jgi:TP901 family phage tail tape measure protein
MTVGEVRALMVADVSRFRAGLTQADALLADMGAKAAAAGAFLGGLGAAVGAGLGIAVREAATMQTALADLNRVLNLTDQELEQVSKRLDELHIATGIADEALSRTLANIARAGMTGAEGWKVLEASMKAAVAGRADVELLGSAIISIIRAYNLSASEAGNVTDTLYQASIKGRMSLQEVSEALKSMGPIASQLGLTIPEVSAALATTTTVGYDAENSIMGLQRAMINLTNPGKQLQAAMKAAGYETGHALIEARGFAGAIQFLTEAAGDDEQAMIQMAGGARAFKAIAALAADGGALFAQKLQELTDSAGSVDAGFAKMQATLEFQWGTFKAAIKEAAEAVGNVFLPPLTALAAVMRTVVAATLLIPGPLRAVLSWAVALGGGLLALIGGFILLRTHLGGTVVLSVQVVAAFARMALGVVGGSAAVSAALGGLQAALIGTRVAVEAFFISLGPIGWAAALVAAIAGVVGGLILWKRHQAEVNKQTADSIQLTKEQTENLKTMLAELQKLQAARAKGEAAGKPPDVTGLQKERDLNNEIAKQYPQLLDYYDRAGNAHLLMEKAVTALTAAEKKHLAESRRSAAEAMAAAAQRRSDLADELEILGKLREAFEALPAGRQETLALHFGPGKTPAEYLKDLQEREAALALKIREATAEYEKRRAVLVLLGWTADKVAREQAAAQAKAAAEFARGTQERLAQIDQEATALRRLGVVAAEVDQWVAMRRLVVAQQNADEVLGIYSKVYEAEGKQHQARVAEIKIEADELRKRATEAKMPAPEVGALVARFEAGELRKLGKERADEAKQHADAALAAEGELAEGLKGYAGRIAGVREYYHNVRLRQIRAEAEEIKRTMIEGGKWTAEAEIKLRELVAQRTAELARDEAREKAEVFAKTAEELMSNWEALNSAMRESGRMRTSEYLMQLAMQLDMIRKIHQAQDQMGQPRGMLEKERSLAQTIYSERQRMIGELGNAERRLAEERKRWGQEELEQRRRVHEAELSMVGLQFQYERDVLEATGRGGPEALAGIARDELAALQQYRQTQMLTAQERLESLQRERELALEIGKAPGGAGVGARGMLEDIFVAMKQAREEMALEEKRAFEQRRGEAMGEITGIEREQMTLRQQIALTGGSIADAARRVFSEIRSQLEAIGRISIAPSLQPAFAGAGKAAAGQKVFNFYYQGKRVEAPADVNRLMDEIAARLEREQRFARE